MNQYNQLRDQMNKLDRDLRKLRNPLRLQLPPKNKIPGADQIAEMQATLGTISDVINNKSNNLFVNKSAEGAIVQEKPTATTTTDEKVAKLKETSTKDTTTSKDTTTTK